jgi:TPR repeat protein
MSLLSRLWSDSDRAKEEELEQRVSALQAALVRCKGVATRWREFGLAITGGVGVAMLVLGFTLGVYREPLKETIVDLLPSWSSANPIAEADAAAAAYQKGDYKTALKLAQPLADEGDARGQSLLGRLYYRGRGVPRDDRTALQWFRRAADQGDTSARFYLGVIYSEGEGVPQDYAEAAQWFRLAAEKGDPQAQYNLGLAYAQGQGVPQDNVTAHMWFNLAAARFPDIRGRDSAAGNRDVVANKMTPDQIVQAQNLAREWRPK